MTIAPPNWYNTHMKNTKTKTKKNLVSLHDRMDKIQEMIEFLSNDIVDGTITNNEITDKLDEIVTKIENFKDLL